MVNILPVILSGGTGTRLWPVSRAGMSKQLVQLIEGESLLQKTVRRVQGSNVYGAPIVIGSHAVRFTLKEQVRQISKEARLIMEPSRRDTMAAVLLAAATVAQDDPDQQVVVMPSDHLITDLDPFHASILTACDAIAEQGIAILGIKPDEPATGFGYIRPQNLDAKGATPVLEFREKPDLTTATRLVDEGWLWNAGIFCFRAGWLLEAAAQFHPEAVWQVGEAVAHMREDLGMLLPGGAFSEVEKISFDHGFMEKTDQALVVPANLQWNDVGDWNAIWQVSAKDSDGNAVQGKVELLDSQDNLIRSERRLVCALGVSNLTIVETGDAVLVAPRDRAQDVRGLVAHLTKQGLNEASEHIRTHRPWGWYETIDLGSRFRVKHITVNPGAKLSLQKHHHRAEHWVVVRGSAEIHVGEAVKMLHENESVYIPIGEIHRLANPGKIPLELIEVQTGSYLEEDDIVRFDDEFGRLS